MKTFINTTAMRKIYVYTKKTRNAINKTWLIKQ